MARLIQRAERGDVMHELLFQSTSIGRGRLNDIVIDDPGERRVHAEVIALGRGGYVVRDSRSRIGVLVNGERIEGQRALADGDVLRVGGAELVFQWGTAESASLGPQGPAQGGGVVKLTVGTLAARVFGYVREVVAMAYFGLSSGLYDAYVAASTLPNLVRDVLGEQAAESAFMPAHRTLVMRGREAEARRLLGSVLRLVVILGVVLTALGIVFAPWLMWAVVPGFAKEHPELMAKATWLARWMMPFLLIIAVASLYGSLLLAERRFWRYSLAPIASSVVMVAAVVLLTGRIGVGSLAAGVVVGGVVQMVVCAAPYWRRDFRLPISDCRFHTGPSPGASCSTIGSRQSAIGNPPGQPALRKVGRSVVPIALAALLGRLGNLVDRILASFYCVVGSISALYESFRLLQLPFGVFGLAVSRAAFPSMIEHASSQDGEGLSRAVVRALRLNMFLMLPATVGLIVLATPFVRLMYERGRFTEADTRLTALALVCYAVGLVSIGSRTVLTRAFYAMLNTRTPFYISAVDVAVNVVLSLALVRTSLRHGGLALATSLASMLHAWLLTVLLGREMRQQGRRLVLAGLPSALLRMAAAGAVMALCTWGCLAGLTALGLGDRLLGKSLRVVVPGGVGLAAYVATAAVLRCEEVRRLRMR